VGYACVKGFEAGGHNAREETTTLCLVPAVVDAVSVPVIAAGGIGEAHTYDRRFLLLMWDRPGAAGCGRSMLAAMALGAEGVQIGSRFVASHEASCHDSFKKAVVEAEVRASALPVVGMLEWRVSCWSVVGRRARRSL
jgi:enoyl-[acyl-carrier protein] reductase II